MWAIEVNHEKVKTPKVTNGNVPQAQTHVSHINNFALSPFHAGARFLAAAALPRSLDPKVKVKKHSSVMDYPSQACFQLIFFQRT